MCIFKIRSLNVVYLFTALYPEAKPLIRVFSLKRVQDGLPFDVYENADTSIRLVISGTGMCAAAAATAAVFGRYRAANEDHLINIGTCAGEVGMDEMSGKAYLCHKLIDRNTGHTYYPDMLYPSCVCRGAAHHRAGRMEGDRRFRSVETESGVCR